MRAARHLVRSVLGLAWRAAAVVSTVLVAAVCITYVASGLDRYQILPVDLAAGLTGLDRRARHGLGVWFDSGGAYALAGIVIAAAIAGSALVAMLEHWRPRALALAWAGAVGLVLVAGPVIAGLAEWAFDDSMTLWRAVERNSPNMLTTFHAAIGVAGALVVAVCATPIGTSVRRGAAGRTARRIRRRRARMRRIQRASA
ncbi:MAG TPA: hypothetical protein PLU35_13070 [Phycisphaerales bacterium]|nr:hypothetical protein [Phycisphaerales bacterium]